MVNKKAVALLHDVEMSYVSINFKVLQITIYKIVIVTGYRLLQDAVCFPSWYTNAFYFLYFSEEFNDRILQPELSDTEKMSLHGEVQKIYKTYCLDESIDKIRFDPFIVEEIQRSKFEFERNNLLWNLNSKLN